MKFTQEHHIFTQQPTIKRSAFFQFAITKIPKNTGSNSTLFQFSDDNTLQSKIRVKIRLNCVDIFKK